MSIKEHAQQVVQANKEHQNALKLYTERLEAELESVDNLLTLAEAADYDDEPDVDVKGYLAIQGSAKASAPFTSAELVVEDSPFYEDAEQRIRYMSLTTIHPMKNKELDTLLEAVKTENYRIHAFNAQRRGENTFPGLDAAAEKDLETNTEGIEWARVAEKVTTHSHTRRTAKECEIRWLGDRHPKIEHGQWSDEDLKRLRRAVPDVDPGEVNWVEISQKFGGKRTPIDCMRRSMNRKVHIWNDDMDERLVEGVGIYGQNNMGLVARHVSEDATVAQCTNRWNRVIDPSISRDPWTAAEDELVRAGVEAYGNSWVEVSAFLPGRSNEHCRERWSDVLNTKGPTNKGKSKAKTKPKPNVPWTQQMDEDLLAAVEDSVPLRWKDVTQQVAGFKTENQCRLRYDALKKMETVEGSAEHEAGTSRDNDRPATRTRSKRSAAVMEEEEEEAPVVPKPKPRPVRKGKEKAVEPMDVDEPPPTPSEAQPEEKERKDLPKPKAKPKPKPKPRAKARVKTKQIASSDDEDEEDELEDEGFEEEAPRKGPKPKPIKKSVAAAAIAPSNMDVDPSVVQEPTRRQPTRSARKPVNLEGL